jgi:hypothetical protein
MECLKKGTVESLLVALRDRLGNVTDLSTVASPTFDVRKKEDNSAVQTGTTWLVDSDFPMTAICLIDTTLSGYVAGDEYKLYIRYTAGSETPIRGPIEFRVEDD